MCAIFTTRLDGMWKGLVDEVNIEVQPEAHHIGKYKKDNTQMKSIGHAIQAYFIAKGVQVDFVNATAKNNIYDGPPVENNTRSQDPYRQRKALSIEETYAILRATGQLGHLMAIALYLKKDDIADAFLQCCYCAYKFRNKE
jgi:hypothetical protein